MSRDVRTKFPSTPVKGTKKRRASVSSSSSSSLDLSDDEGGYSGVEAISDSDDDDDEDALVAEEEQWLANELQKPDSQSRSSPPRPVDADEEGDAEEGDDEDDPDSSDDDQDDDDDDPADDSASWEGFGSEHNAPAGHPKAAATGNASDTTSTVERRVRFDVPDSDGDTTESDHGVDFFPDIFVDQSTLDPSFRREIEMDGHDSDQSGGFWDIHGPPEAETPEGAFTFYFDDDSTPAANPFTFPETFTGVSTPVASPEKLLDDDGSLDGYQSDGETTEDEDIPERRERTPQRRPRREVTEEVSDSDAVTLIKPRRGKPRVGIFNLDSTGKKPVAVVNPRTGKLMIFTPQRLRRLDLSPETFNFPLWDPAGQDTPLLSNSGNLMMGAMFSSNTFGDFMNTQAVGPVEAFFHPDVQQTAVEEESSDDVADGDEEEHRLNVDDFLNLGNASSDDGGGQDDEAGDPFSPTPTRTTSKVSDEFMSLLSHFENNRDIVGAFRRDQANNQLIRNGKATRESLAFSSPFFEGTLRGVKDGRLPDTNIPISPLRKQKKMAHMASSPLAPMSQKRKATTTEQPNGHKRQRSMPELDALQINS